MSQPPENPAQEAQELATTPTIEPRQESTLLQQAQESLQIMETPSQNKEDESKLYLILHLETLHSHLLLLRLQMTRSFSKASKML